MPDWPSIEARHEPLELLPYKQNFSFDMSVVMDLVQAVLTEPDPDAALAEHLSAMQAAQQVRFAELPAELKSDDRVLLRHQNQLGANQTNHDAALKVLRLVAAAWGS